MCPASPSFLTSPKERNARAHGKFSPISAPILNIRTCRRVTRRPCVNGKPRARRRNKPTQGRWSCYGGDDLLMGSRLKSYFLGPHTRFGLAVAAIACVLDQAS